MKTLLLTCAAILVASAPARAAFQYAGPSRAVAAGAASNPYVYGFGTDTHQELSSDLSPWIGSVNASAGDGSAHASQTSWFLDQQILFAGEVTAKAHSYSSASATAYLNVNFTLATDTIYISGLIMQPAVVATGEWVNLTQGLGFDFNSTGTLPAGVYHLQLAFQAIVPQESGDEAGGSFIYELGIIDSVPMPTSGTVWVVGIVLPLWHCCRRRR